MSILRSIKRVFKRIFAIIPMMKDKDVSLWKKALVIFGFIYFVLPFEAFTDFIFPFGYIDDILLWICIYLVLRDTLDNHTNQSKSDKINYSKRYNKNDIIDDVDFEVVDEKQPK